MTTPGDILFHDLMEPFEISVQDLSKKTGIIASTLGNIICGKERISSLTGAPLDKFYGFEEGFWYQLQISCDRIKVAKEKAASYRDTYLVRKEQEELRVKEEITHILASANSAQREVELTNLINALSTVKTEYKDATIVLLEMMARNDAYVKDGLVYLTFV